MKWRRGAPGIYNSEDDRFWITFIPGHWELSMLANHETGAEADVWDFQTLAEAKAAVDRDEEAS